MCCTNGHSFDLAREGYVNLLPTNRRLSSTVGDSLAMLQARRRFLAGGYFLPLADRVLALVSEYIPDYAQFYGRNDAILDIGCGEGYYLRQLRSEIKVPHCAFGLDIAKTAVKMAAKQDPTTQYIAADVNGRLPFLDQSIAFLLNIFAPRNVQEFGRICRGCLLIVIPTPNHLLEIRSQLNLLGIEPDKASKVIAQFRPLFNLLHEEKVRILLQLDPAQLNNLVLMTPNARHRDTQRLSQIPLTETNAEMQILLFSRLKAPAITP